MKPNTAHFVITTDHAICFGGHFLMTRAMQLTLQGLIHTFVLDRFLTNTSHEPSRSLLRRILLFYYQGLLLGEVSLQGMSQNMSMLAFVSNFSSKNLLQRTYLISAILKASWIYFLPVSSL